MLGKFFTCPQRNEEKITYNEMIYFHSWKFMTTSDCCFNRIKSEFVVQNSKEQELLDLKALFDVFKNGFKEAMVEY